MSFLKRLFGRTERPIPAPKTGRPPRDTRLSLDGMRLPDGFDRLPFTLAAVWLLSGADRFNSRMELPDGRVLLAEDPSPDGSRLLHIASPSGKIETHELSFPGPGLISLDGGKTCGSYEVDPDPRSQGPNGPKESTGSSCGGAAFPAAAGAGAVAGEAAGRIGPDTDTGGSSCGGSGGGSSCGGGCGG